MPPEAFVDRAEVDVRGDVYSFGVVLYEMLTGRGLFRGPGLSTVPDRRVDARPEAPRRMNPMVPAQLDAITLKCLEIDPAKRYATFAELEKDLKRVAARLLRSLRLHALPSHEGREVKDDLVVRAYTLMELGRHADALAEFTELLRRKPKEPEFHNNIAVCLAELGRVSEACVSVRRALDLRPTYAEAWANLGLYLCRSGSYEDAIVACDRAISLKPTWAEAHANRGMNLLRLGRPSEADSSFEKALQVDPKYWRALVMAAESAASQRKPPRDVLALAQRALDIQPREPAALAIAAACLQDLRQESEADRYLALAQTVDARHPLVLLVVETIQRKRASM